jgi:hypothetical protein
MPSQVSDCKRNFEHGSLLQTRQSIIIMHAKFITGALQHGSPKAAHSMNGRRTDRYCGSVATVYFSVSSAFMAIDSFLYFAAGAGKSIIWYAASLLVS